MSSFTEGQTHQLMEALEKGGFTPGDITLLGQFGDKTGLLGVLRDTHKITLRPRRWREEDGIIYFLVTSNGWTGEQWITILEGRGFRISEYAKSMLRSPGFKPTNGATTEIAILKGMFWGDNDRFTKKIRAFAGKRKLTAPNAEVACLIREMFTDKEIEAMGLTWVVTMHEPIKDSDGDPGLLGASRDDDGRWLDAYWDGPGGRWDREHGFAFVAPPAHQRAGK